MSTFSDTSPILIKKRKGDSTDPFKPISENLKIVHNTAILNEIPDNFRRVNIEGMIEKRIDFYNENNSIAENEYIVDYKLGYVFFNKKMNDKTVETEYLGTGVVLYPASRIYDTGREDVIVTIQEMINGGREAIEAYGNIDTAIKTAEEYYVKISTCIDNAKEINNTLNITIVNGTDINDILNKTIKEATKINDTLGGTIINGTNKINEIDTLIEEFDNNENTRQTTFDNNESLRYKKANSMIQEFSICEEYNSEKDYKKLNRVSFKGSSYECIKDCKNILPSSKEYWICIAEKGKDGEGSGDMHTEKYDKDEDGIVDFADDSNKLGGKLADEYALKSEVSSNVNIKSFKNTIILEEETNKVKIGISEFNMNIDELLVYQNGIYIEKDKEYKISLDGLYIEKINGSWNKNTIFNFVMYKGLKDKIEYEDGALILNGSITLEKLNLDIQNKINSINEKLDKKDLEDKLSEITQTNSIVELTEAREDEESLKENLQKNYIKKDDVSEQIKPFQDYIRDYPEPVTLVNNVKPDVNGNVQLYALDIKFIDGGNLEQNFSKLISNDQNARNDIMDIKLKLKEKLAVDFINKSGVGFYDTFETNEYIESTTATWNKEDATVDFGSPEQEQLVYQAVNNSNEIELVGEKLKVGDRIKVGDKLITIKEVL